MIDTSRDYVVLGGGIAGVACAQELRRLDPQRKTTLVSSDSTLRVRSYRTALLDDLMEF